MLHPKTSRDKILVAQILWRGAHANKPQWSHAASVATVTVFCLAAVVAWVLVPTAAQDRTASTVRLGSMLRVGQAGNSDWPLHNLDVFNRRYSSAKEIDPSNASKLALKWSFDTEGGIAEITPLVVDGVM
jgi:glucose dehydrogenase